MASGSAAPRRRRDLLGSGRRRRIAVCPPMARDLVQGRPFVLFEEGWQTRAMQWSPTRDALRGRVAVVAGATRGAGRGIAAALGEPGATVVCTGRAQPAREYGFTDLDGSRPDIWRYIEEIRERGLRADRNDYR